jgi:hypothetical protein
VKRKCEACIPVAVLLTLAMAIPSLGLAEIEGLLLASSPPDTVQAYLDNPEDVT